MIIGVDKGHTVQNGGVCGACGLLKESVENRPVGNKVIEKLRALGNTVIDCSCDYSKDRDEQLAAIVKKANAQKLDLFLSLHLNAGGGTGAEVYTTNTSGAKSEAKKLIDTYCNRTGFKNRGHKYAEFYVLRHTVAPAMLIEMAFVDTEADYKKWNDLGAELIANAIVEGITGQAVQEKPVETPSTTSYTVKITADVLNVRAGAGTNYKVNTQVRKGEVYTIVGESNGWGKLKSGAGWISLKYTSKNGPSTPANKPTQTIKVGSKVKIVGSKYATGQSIPSWVKDNVYTVQQIKGDRALIKEITSWVYTKDLKLV
ncbi:N-acetylmuramoyl-L-alanine amidase [Clostridium paraputrificum]|uniref:N-acetylmuramoyl-L-alanine amidase n=1 Tax=Clostridium paraputrificum TaxID=29363 RepID=UPI00232ADB80|nr:N-acetylmuramoyl-L-alanine amidase [Clostridium paraputrificum]MDB2075614.1 N-acetylmuramoyl-L-alanine amidase [Clostridium paraputrificum]MDB2079881.1 N-acetylmuramoyl-L-alanine amidase [Clostridium paraputrificum]